MKVLAILLFTFAAGCVRTTSWGSGASGMHPPALPPGASVPKWDHFCASVSGDLHEISRYLDEASENGWELVTWGDYNLACFKRQRVAPAPASREAPPSAPSPATPASR